MQGRLTNQEVIDKFHQIIGALQLTIDNVVPVVDPTIRHKPGFSPACKAKCREANRLRKQAHAIKHTPKGPAAWEAYRKARNEKTGIVKKSLTESWQETVTKACSEGPKGLWRLVKMTRAKG